MKKNKRNNTKVIETITYTNFEQAQKTVNSAKVNLIRISIGFALSVAATICTLILLGDGSKTTLIPVSMLLGIASYLIGGGIFKALKMAGKFAKIGWFIIPAFPADLLIGFGTLIMSAICFLFVPVIFVGMNFIQHKKNLDEANRYLANCARMQHC